MLLSPSTHGNVNIVLQRVERFYDRGDLLNAMKCLQTVQKSDPDNTEVQMWGRKLHEAEDVQQAAKAADTTKVANAAASPSVPEPNASSGPSSSPPVVQVFWVMRHGDRLNKVDRNWKKTAAYPDDTPLSDVGHVQAMDVANYIKENDNNLRHIISSPFLRALETASPLSLAADLPIKVEKSVWETGCSRPPPLHLHLASRRFNVDGDYLSTFEPRCGEQTTDFFPRLTRAAAGLLERFPVHEGNVAVFSHADPSAYLVAALCGMDPTLTAPVTPCSIFRLERREGEANFRLTMNASLEHLSVLGRTKPCHPVHFAHDWSELFDDMKRRNLLRTDFEWPPSESELAIVKQEWTSRYQRLLQSGKSENFPVVRPISPSSSRKVCFKCLLCGVTSFVRKSLVAQAPPGHIVNCWKCRGSYLLRDIVIVPEVIN